MLIKKLFIKLVYCTYKLRLYPIRTKTYTIELKKFCGGFQVNQEVSNLYISNEDMDFLELQECTSCLLTEYEITITNIDKRDCIEFNRFYLSKRMPLIGFINNLGFLGPIRCIFNNNISCKDPSIAMINKLEIFVEMKSPKKIRFSYFAGCKGGEKRRFSYKFNLGSHKNFYSEIYEEIDCYNGIKDFSLYLSCSVKIIKFMYNGQAVNKYILNPIGCRDTLILDCMVIDVRIICFGDYLGSTILLHNMAIYFCVGQLLKEEIFYLIRWLMANEIIKSNQPLYQVK